MRFHAIIVAAGSGTRAGGKKQWLPLAGKPVLQWSVDAFRHAGASRIVVVVTSEDLARAEAMGVTPVEGGDHRAASVMNGLGALKGIDEGDIVMVHDAARPLLNDSHINSLLEKLKVSRAAILALPVTDSLKSGTDGFISGAPDRSGLWRAQTPQAFRYGDLCSAYAAFTGGTPTDDAQVVADIGIEVALVEGDMRLHKLTYVEDFALLEAFMAQDAPKTSLRVGQGFDAHRWGDGESVWLCGVEISHTQTLIGHSDADAGLHALTDALLGAAGLGDIGDHFPPTDPQWKGAPSDLFLRHAVDLIRQKGGEIINVDVTLICEQPKIKPHREAMRLSLAEILNIDLERVSIKATTTEKMGFTGRGEGLAAQAIALIQI